MTGFVDLAALAQLPQLLERVKQLEAEVEALRAAVADRSPSPDELISIDAAAQLCAKTRAALYQLVRRGRLPAERRGRALLVRRADAEALAKGGTR